MLSCSTKSAVTGSWSRFFHILPKKTRRYGMIPEKMLVWISFMAKMVLVLIEIDMKMSLRPGNLWKMSTGESKCAVSASDWGPTLKTQKMMLDSHVELACHHLPFTFRTVKKKMQMLPNSRLSLSSPVAFRSVLHRCNPCGPMPRCKLKQGQQRC